MHTFDDLIRVLKKDVVEIPTNNTALLTMIGFETSMIARSMIGYPQGMWWIPSALKLKPSTIAYKRKHGWGMGGNPETPLYRTGDFYKSIQYRIQGNRVSIGSNIDYVRYTEYGTSKQDPRPIFRPALLTFLNQPMWHDHVDKLYLKNLRKG